MTSPVSLGMPSPKASSRQRSVSPPPPPLRARKPHPFRTANTPFEQWGFCSYNPLHPNFWGRKQIKKTKGRFMETRLESGQDLKNAAREGAQQAADATREAAGRFSAAMQSAKTSVQEKSAAGARATDRTIRDH